MPPITSMKPATLFRGRHDGRSDAAMALAPALPTLVIHPGDVVCVNEGTTVQTLLGSCVAICMADAAHTVGAMCHYVHCASPRPGFHQDATFAEVAMQRMFAELRSRGVDPRACEAYVCGGGAMRLQGLEGAPSVGSRNVGWARQFLAAQGVLTHEVSVGGGACYRKVHWRVGQGAPVVRVLPIEGKR